MNAKQWYEIGMANFREGDLDRARKSLMRAVLGEPENLTYLLDYGLVYCELRRFDKAHLLYRQAAFLDPNAPEVHYRLGNLYKQFGQTESALQHYNKVLELEPRNARASNNRGAVHEMCGRIEEAGRDYRLAIELDSRLDEAYLNLGRLLDSQGDYDAAAKVYADALAVGGNADLFNHLRASLKGENPDKAAPGYVRSMFDDAALHFDEHLSQNLGYSLPALIADRLRVLCNGQLESLVVVDLGCGTGLVGAQLGAGLRHLTGVDLSPRMLDQADLRGIYKDLVEGDAEKYLQGLTPGSVDAVVCADTLIYLGDLAPLVKAVTRCLRSGGAFLFSIETLDSGDSYALQKTGRFRHQPSYLRAVVAEAGLQLVSEEAIALRLERGIQVSGMLFVTKSVQQD